MLRSYLHTSIDIWRFFCSIARGRMIWPIRISNLKILNFLITRRNSNIFQFHIFNLISCSYGDSIAYSISAIGTWNCPSRWKRNCLWNHKCIFAWIIRSNQSCSSALCSACWARWKNHSNIRSSGRRWISSASSSSNICSSYHKVTSWLQLTEPL